MANYDFLVYDAETFGFSSKVKVIGFTDGVDIYSYQDVDSFLDGLIEYSKGKKIKVFGHNAGKFDNKILLETILKNPKYSKMLKFECIIGGSLYLRLTFGKTKIMFWDSFRIMPTSLKKLGKDFGFQKLDYEDYDEHLDEEKLKEYFKNDLFITHKILSEFYNILTQVCKELNINVDLLRYKTIAGNAFSILGHCKYEEKELMTICKNWLSKDAEDYIRKAYIGGRTEVFLRKIENANYYDVNSLYPTAMYYNDFPYGNCVFVENKILLKRFIDDGSLGIIKCRIIESACEKNDIYYLGYKHNKALVFGDLRNVVGYWTTFEIKRALEIGYKIEILEGYLWQKKGKLFKEYVNSIYKIKEKAEKQNKPALRYIAKLLLNSAYGKFGQRRSQNRLLTEREAIVKKIPFSQLEMVMRGIYKQEYTSYSNRQVNPVYACFITAYSRDHLYNLIKECDFDVAYIDTDSVITHKELKTGSGLGELKKEMEIKEAYFVVPKCYAIHNTKDEYVVKAKGIINKKGVDVGDKLTYDDVKEIVETNKIKKISQKRLLGFLEQGKRVLYKTAKSFINEVEYSKVIKSNELKRLIKPNYKTEALKIYL